MPMPRVGRVSGNRPFSFRALKPEALCYRLPSLQWKPLREEPAEFGGGSAHTLARHS